MNPSSDLQTDQSAGQNIVHMPDGSTQVFPGNVTPQQMAQALKLGIPQGTAPTGGYNFDPALNKAIDFIRPFVGNAAGLASAAGVGLLTKNPAAAFGAETQGYAGIDSLMQQLKTRDQAPASFTEGLAEGEKQAFLNAISQRIVGGLFRGGKAFFSADQPEIYNFKPTTAQALESFGYNRLATIAKFAEDFGATGSKSEALDRAGGAGFTQALKFANAVNGRTFTINSDPVKLADKLREDLSNGLMPADRNPNHFVTSLHVASQEALDTLNGGSNPFMKIDQVLQDPDRLSKVLTAGQLAGQAGLNVRKDLQSYQFMKMMNDATTKDATGAIRIDPTKLSSTWNDPEMNTSLNTLWGKGGRQDVSDFIKQIAYTQDKQDTYPVAKALRFIDGGFMLGAGLLTGNLNIAGGAAAFGGLFVPTAVIGNALTKPGVARVLTAMAGAEPLNPVLKRASAGLWDTLQGTSVALMDSGGKKTWGTIQKDKDTGEVKFIPNK